MKKVHVGRAYDGPETPQVDWNNISESNVRENIFIRWRDLQLNDDEKGLERFGDVGVVDETNGFGLDFFEKTESGLWSTTPDVGAVP